MKLTPYHAYKPSGVEWLGDMPAHWGVRRLRTISSVLNGATPSSNTQEYWDGEIVWITPQDLGSATTKFIMSGERNITLAGYKSCATTLAKAGSLVVSTRAPIGHVAILEVSACVNQGCRLIVSESTTVKSEFLYFILSTAKDELTSLGKGTTFAELSNETLSSFIVPMPPLPEQTTIVRYLNHATECISRYINAKERLISLLEEQRQAVIHRAVTQGLDPNVRFKPSGNELLGNVPDHWEIRRLKSICSMKSGDYISGIKIESMGKYPVYGGNGIRGYTSDYNKDGNFVLIGRQGALCGNVHVVRGRFWATEHAVIATLRPEHVVDWFGFILKITNLNQYSIAAAQPGLAVERILNIALPVPSQTDQFAIAEFLKKTTTDIDAAISRAHREIELLKEYRTRLNADVVTGKLDVREVAFKLPKVPDESRPPDKVDDASQVKMIDEHTYSSSELPVPAVCVDLINQK